VDDVLGGYIRYRIGASYRYPPILPQYVLPSPSHRLSPKTNPFRVLLAAGRIQAAQNLLTLLPPELSSIDDPEPIATEYLHYRQFFLIWDVVARVGEWQAQGEDFDSSSGGRGQGQGQGQTTAERDVKAAWVLEYSVGFFFCFFFFFGCE